MTKDQSSQLKEFTRINSAFIIKNDEIAVMATDKSVCAFFNPTDMTDFETPAHVYNVDELLSVIDTLGIDSKLTIKDKVLMIKNGNKQLRYVLSNETTVPAVSNRIEDKFNELDIDIEFTLNKVELEQIKKMASLLGLDEVQITCMHNMVEANLCEQDNASSNNMSIKLDGTGNDCSVSISVESLSKLSSGTYSVKSSVVGLSKFESQDKGTLRYYLANLSK
jgi:hypothetical protein